MLRSLILLSLIAFGACRCEEAVAPPRKALAPIPQKPLEGEAKEAAARLPKPTGTPVPAEELSKLLPDKVGTAHATGAVTARTTPMANKGVMTAARRQYQHDQASLQVEVSDTLHAPAIRLLVDRQVDVERSTKNTFFSGTRIEGHPALVQWNAKSSTAFINLLVGGRLLVNLKLEPAESPEPVIALAQEFPYVSVERLAARAKAEHDAQQAAEQETDESPDEGLEPDEEEGLEESPEQPEQALEGPEALDKDETAH
jgi:hypothetical protein